MVVKVTQFKASTGKTFDSEYDAFKDELRDFLMSHGADNEAIATKIVAAIDKEKPESLRRLTEIVEGMERSRPCKPIAPETAQVITCQQCLRPYDPLRADCPYCEAQKR